MRRAFAGEASAPQVGVWRRKNAANLTWVASCTKPAGASEADGSGSNSGF
jgi:hypothetical protein